MVLKLLFSIGVLFFAMWLVWISTRNGGLQSGKMESLGFGVGIGMFFSYKHTFSQLFSVLSITNSRIQICIEYFLPLAVLFSTFLIAKNFPKKKSPHQQ